MNNQLKKLINLGSIELVNDLTGSKLKLNKKKTHLKTKQGLYLLTEKSRVKLINEAVETFNKLESTKLISSTEH